MKKNNNDLYFHNTEHCQVCILNSQFENIFNYTKRQIRDTKKQEIFTRSSCIHRSKTINIIITEDIFGPGIYALKNKMVHTAPHRVTVDYIVIPKKLLRLYQKVLIGIDYMFINGLTFFITVFFSISNLQ